MTDSAELREFCQIVQGGRHRLSGNDFVSNGYPAYGAGGLNGYLNSYEFERCAIVLSSIGARCGKCFFADGKWSSLANTQLIFPDPSRADARFLWYQLNDERRWHRSGTGQPFIKPSDVKSHKVFLPPLDVQRRIACVLDAADELQVKRRAAVAKLDTLAQSIFIDMFGDPATNSKIYVSCKLGDLINSASDGPHVSPEYVEVGIPFLSTRHIRPGQIIWDDLKFISEHDAMIQWKKCRPQKSDILYTKGGTTGVAAVVDTDRPFAVWVHVALLKPRSERVEPIWLEAVLNSAYCYRQSQKLTHGIANHDLGLKRMVNIQMFCPPLSEQRNFVKAAQLVRKQRDLESRALVEMEALFRSLQYRAFRGEL